MDEMQKRSCADMIRIDREVREGWIEIHKGSVFMAEIKVTLVNIGAKVDGLEKKIDRGFEEFSKDIEELKMKPAKRWDGLITMLITLIVGVMFGLFIHSIGL